MSRYAKAGAKQVRLQAVQRNTLSLTAEQKTMLYDLLAENERLALRANEAVAASQLHVAKMKRLAAEWLVEIKAPRGHVVHPDGTVGPPPEPSPQPTRR